MIISYVDPSGKRLQQHIKATVTTKRPPGRYGQPVIILEDGEVVDSFSWITKRYRVVKANKKEISALEYMGLL